MFAQQLNVIVLFCASFHTFIHVWSLNSSSPSYEGLET